MARLRLVRGVRFLHKSEVCIIRRLLPAELSTQYTISDLARLPPELRDEAWRRQTDSTPVVVGLPEARTNTHVQ